MDFCFYPDHEYACPEVEHCPHLGGAALSTLVDEASDHLQEDVVGNLHQVVLYRHAAGRCRECRRWVRQAGPGEILGSRIGPRMRALAMYLRNHIGISYRKVPQALEEMFGFSFVPASLMAFEKVLAEMAEPLSEDIAKKLGSSDGAVHADETYWTLNGERAYCWLHATTQYVHFQFDSSRAGEVSRNVLGSGFTGTLVTDCYSAYHAHEAGAKQKCLAHVARRAHKWQRLTTLGSADHAFFEDVKQWVKRGCEFHRRRVRKELSPEALAAEDSWLRAELSRLETCPLEHEKALTLQARLQRHHDEWLVFVADPRVPPTNNLAERKLRPLVVLRKVTFGHRTEAGARRMAKIMTVQETAKAHGHKVSDFFYYLQTHSPSQSLRHLYSGP